MSAAAITSIVNLFVFTGYSCAGAMLAFFIAFAALAVYNRRRPVWSKSSYDLWSAFFLLALGVGGSLGYYACAHFSQSPLFYGQLLDATLVLDAAIVSVVTMTFAWRHQKRHLAYRRAARYYR
jgi:polyferredoxin